jgi:hypothetical protein
MTKVLTQRKVSKKQAKFILHEAKTKAGEIYQERRRHIENEFNAAMRPVRDDYIEKRAKLKQEYLAKLEPVYQQFESDAKPIVDLRETQNIQAKAEYQQNVLQIKADYLNRKNGGTNES